MKNNIPFKASLHYDAEYMYFNKNSKYIMSAQNLGNQLCPFNEFEIMRKTIKVGRLKPLEKISVKKYLKQNDSSHLD